MLMRLKEAAEKDPSNVEAQALYLKLANHLQQIGLVLDHLNSGKYPLNDDIYNEYVSALGRINQQAGFLLHQTLQTGYPTIKSPFPVQVSVPFKGVVMILMGIFAVGFVLIFVTGSMSSSNPFQSYNKSSVKQYDPSEQRETVKFNDVKGNYEAKEEMMDLVEYLQNPAKFISRGVHMPKGVLLVGEPGTGKTLLAKALAGEAEVPFLYSSGAEFEEIFVGVGASRIRQLFAKARQMAPCIVFIDEIDAVAMRRSSLSAHRHYGTLNQLLVELDGFSPSEGVLVVAATNVPLKSLDPALIRPGRFDRHVRLNLPDLTTRKEILDHYLRGKKADESVDLEGLSRTTYGFSGADLFNLVNWAAIESIKQNVDSITMELLENAKENVYMGKERKMTVSEASRKLTAYHEAGHAIVTMHSEGAPLLYKVTIVPRGNALGLTASHTEDENNHFQTFSQYKASMDVCMGGRAAEELVFGPEHVSSGASNDFNQATSIARMMVMNGGMSTKLGHMYIDDEDVRNQLVSPETLSVVDKEIHQLVETSYGRAVNVLKNYQEELHLLAKALLQYETLTAEEVKDVVAGKPLPKTKKTSQQKKAEETRRAQEKAPKVLDSPRTEVAVETTT